MNPPAPLWLNIVGIAFFLFLEVGVWFMIFDMKRLVVGHLINLGKGDWHQPVKRTGVEILWYLILLGTTAGLSIFLSVDTTTGSSIGPMTMWKTWSPAVIGNFFVLTLLAGLIEYLRIMIRRTGIAYAAYDVIAWLAALIAVGLILGLLLSPLRACL